MLRELLPLLDLVLFDVKHWEEEAHRQSYWITQSANTLLRLTIKRIKRQNADKDYDSEE